MTPPAAERAPYVWDLFFAAVAGSMAAAVLAQPEIDLGRRIVATAAIVAMSLLYGLWGRRLLFHRAEVAALCYVVATLALFTAGTLAVSSVSYLLFALCPVIFLVLPVRTAVGAVVCANLLPLLAAVGRGGIDWYVVTHLGPIFIMTAVASVWLGVWINRVVSQSSERAALIAELESSRAEVTRLSHAAGAAEERARLAGEIHDTLAQGFTSIITLLQAADPELRDERLALAVRTARENLAESRALIAALAPSALGSGSLQDAVRRQVSRFTEECGLAATFRVSGESRGLPTAAEVVLLRAAQEALTNVRRHAAANEAAVLLAYQPDRVRLVVRDDGRGFDAEGAGGFGLAGMRARATQVGGTLVVRSDPGTGTTIELEVPA
ncbi:MAG: sensor histidine kinase [Actinoplanes sp.]